MEKQEEDHKNDAVEGKITTFASPYVLAAILADEPAERTVLHNMVVVNENGENSEIVTDSLDVSLNDSLESTKLQAIGDFDRQDQVAINKDKPILTNDGNSVLGTEKVSDLPKSSTPVRNASSGTKKRAAEKAPKPHRSQYIIERNKEKAGKRSTAKTSYAQMHVAKTRNKLDKTDKKAKTQEAETQENSFGSDSGYHLGNEEEINGDKDQNPKFANNADQCVEVNGRNSELEEHRSDLHALDHSHLNGSLNAYHNHGPYYDVSQNYSIYDASFTSGAVSHARDYQSEHLRQSDAVLDPFPPMPHQNLSTQSAPPGVYGYQRKPLISSLHHFNGDYSLSSVLPNSEFVTSERRDKIPESSLHRKFQSEPDLGHSSSPSLQRVASAGRNSKASGSYSSLLQPSPYKPYTWKDYQNFVGSKIKPLAGGLGPNVDTDDFKEKVKNLQIYLY